MIKTTLKSVIALIVLVMVVAGAMWWLKGPEVVPSSISKQADYAIFYPTQSQQIIIDKSSFKYASQLKQVSFIVRFANRDITFAEQSSPDSFSDDPNFYTHFVTSLNSYTAFASVYGTVNLTIPSETKNETAVMNSKGTLLFAQSTNGKLNENYWKKLFNSLAYVRPN